MPTVSLPLPADAIFPASATGARKAAALLNDGKLVVLPTETVYGIALNLKSDAARHAARLLKQNAAENPHPTPDNTPQAPWVIHVAQPDDLLAWVPGISFLGRRIITKSLPGPVAFEIKLEPAAEKAARARLGPVAADETIHDGFLTLRCPECLPTQDVLSLVPDPVAVIGAGTRTRPAVIELADLSPALDPDRTLLHAAIDAGPTRYRRSSTLVRITGEHYSIIRPGVIDERFIHRMADLTILFLCSGNTCRSPMAAALAARQLADRLKIKPDELPLRHIVVQSAGLHAGRGSRATPEAIEAVKHFGADLSFHLSQSALADGAGLLRRADIIYTMTDTHREEVLKLLPSAERKVHRLDPEGDIDDPIGAPFSVYQRVARRLTAVIEKRLKELAL